MSELGYFLAGAVFGFVGGFLAGAVFGFVGGWFVCAYIMGTIIKKEGPEKILEIFKKK